MSEHIIKKDKPAQENSVKEEIVVSKNVFDYEELGFKCGIEIHQQLAGKKLFCNCPCQIRKDVPDFSIIRRLRASAGELGKVDKAALHEQQKSKIFEYLGYNDSTCLVEMDEEPPHPVNMVSIEAALIAAKLLNMKIVDSIQFMRKTVIDGSNTSGFQRTALIGYDGFVEVNGKKICVDTLCLEEDACQVIERKNDKDVYNLSRLGIPLIEIATAPDIRSPNECKEVAGHIGMLLRSTGKILRGIGTIRQDVNISIKGSSRIEIKGFQDIRSIPIVIDNEIKRQINLIKDAKISNKKIESEVRKAESDMSTSFLRPMPGADRMYPETDIETIDSSNIHVDKPLTLKEREQHYVKKYGLSNDLSALAVKYESKNEEGYTFEDDFNKYCSEYLSSSNIVSSILINVPEAEKKSGNKLNWFKIKDPLFTSVSSGNIASSSLPDVLFDVASSGEFKSEKYKQVDDSEIENIIEKIIVENPGANKGLIMGKVMSALKGKADGKKVMILLDLKLK
ncbi:MAG: Glu-tRNA(Gln) amidotransferase subunit GatE [Candidatus Woesearchaeota archaeon]|jgi:Glu-tRNA(Gln) amidotransferase subunit E-like FAD-binding protein